MPDKGWSRAFEDPIPLTRGRQLVTLKEDAADYITRLPKAEHESAQWQAATEALIMAAEGRGLAYNLTRVINIMGPQPLMAAIRA
jgi:hypothetical protein